ncbi:MAG: biotin--[acetyl-CoA-carboxylase] ligase [Spirochaetales bacterium]|nr:biotin--[acetyl-CoA-carboxylase] ligase [Spirochaetales bacterium]
MKRLEIANPWRGAPVYFKEATVSTMEDARRLFSSGCPDGTVVSTGFQQRGRGRLSGRRWIAAAGRNLLFTVVLRASRGSLGGAPQRLPLLAGLASALSVEKLYGLAVRLKWPNDLLAEGKKLAGILCEATVEGDSLGVLIGIGVNCNQLTFPAELEPKATSLARLLGCEVGIPELFAELLAALKASLADEDWHAKVVERLYGLNHEVLLLSPEDRTASRNETESRIPPPAGGQRGIIRGLNRDGSLLFQPRGGCESIAVYGGEIRFAGEEDS